MKQGTRLFWRIFGGLFIGLLFLLILSIQQIFTIDFNTRLLISAAAGVITALFGMRWLLELLDSFF